MNKFIILKDTREHKRKGWNFRKTDVCDGMEKFALKTGDYTIKGVEDILCIERKGRLTEFAQNIIEDRFYRELDRMEEYKYSFLLLEFNFEDLLDYPRSIDLPWRIKSKIKITGAFLLKKLIEIECKYKTKIIFCGSRGQDCATAIFKKVWQIIGNV